MEALWDEAPAKAPAEPKWIRMVAISGLVHLAAFSLIFLIPDYSPSSRVPGAVYEVDLVELPKPGPPKPAVGKTFPSETAKTTPIASKISEPPRRISRPAPAEKPVVVAKRTLEVKPREKVTPEVPPSRLVDEAVSRIERKVRREEVAKSEPADATDRVSEAIAKLRDKQNAAAPEATGSPGAPGTVNGGGSQASGIAISMYQLAVEERIKSNWSYPVALTNPKADKDLSAIVVLKVRSDGSIIESRIKQPSSDVTFDRSVIRAIERSDPLPPFPEGYHKSQDEMEINFNLRDLKRN